MLHLNLSNSPTIKGCLELTRFIILCNEWTYSAGLKIWVNLLAQPILTSSFKRAGVHPERVEPTSRIELTKLRIEAPQTWRLWESSLEFFTQSILHLWGGEEEVPGLPWAWLLTSSAGHNFFCATYDAVCTEEGPLSVHLWGSVAKPTEPSSDKLSQYNSRAKASR